MYTIAEAVTFSRTHHVIRNFVPMRR